MIVWRSIEFRLTAWYSLLLLAGLATLGAVLWFGATHGMVAAIDDLLEARVHHLVDFVEAEFGNELGDSPEYEEGKVKGAVAQVDLSGRSFAVGDVTVHFDSETVFESESEPFGPSSLREGQYVEVDVERRGGAWFAAEVSWESSFPEEFLEELHEYARAVPDGRLIRIRTQTGEPLLPAGPEAEGRSVVPWRDPETSERTSDTIEVSGGVFRVLSTSADLAGRPYQIQVAASLAAVVATRERLLVWTLWVIPIGVLLSFIGGYAISRGALRPVEDVAEVASRMDVNRLSERLPVPPTGDVLQKLTETFNQMLGRLESSLKRLEEFTADASHELRSPVAVIRTTAELALRQARKAEDLRTDMVEIHGEATRLTELIGDLLTLARADSRADAAPMSEVDLVSLAQDGCDQFRRMANGRKLELWAVQSGAMVWGHEPSLRRLLVILLDNAVRHPPEGAAVRVSVFVIGDSIFLEVADTGDGIPEEELNRVFDRFYRGDLSRNRSKGGIGLGLSIAKWIAESHGGEITARSEVGKGTTFSVRFPRSRGARKLV